jgi:regulator of sigma E protease
LSAGDPLEFEVERDGAIIPLTAVPKRVEIDDGFGNKAYAGQLGISAARDSATWITYGPLQALRESVRKVANILTSTVRFLGRLILGKEDTRQLGGPVKMAKYAGQTAMSGFEGDREDGPPLVDRLKISLGNFINLAAIISVSIGFLNLLPIPVLDGGHLLYYGYEAVAGKPLGAKAQAIGFRVGIVLLASFMLFVTWNDITNLLSLKS